MKTKDMVLQTLIEDGPMTAQQIATILGIEQTGAQWHLRMLRENHQAHICRYIIEADRKDTRVWAAGDAEDAPKPTRIDRIEAVTGKPYRPPAAAPTRPPMTQEQREKLQEEYQAREDAKRRKRLLADIKPFRDPFLWVLFQGEEACA